MTARSSKTDPYCAFTDDGKRLQALVARDIRITVIACACLLIGGRDLLVTVIRWGLG